MCIIYTENMSTATGPVLEDDITFIKEGDPTATPPVLPLQYGQTLKNVYLKQLNISTADPAYTINPFLKNPEASINNAATGGFNCLMYDNVKGLINDFSKDPTICSLNPESKCTLSAFTDEKLDTVESQNIKDFAGYKALIGDDGLQIKRETVSCGDKTNILMWVYKDKSGKIGNDAIGVPVQKCGTLELDDNDLSTSTTSIKALCNSKESYALVLDEVTGAGYKCKVLLPDNEINNPTRSEINPSKCDNL